MTNLSRLRCSHKSMGLCLFLLPRSFKVLSDNLMRVLCTARRQLFKYSHKYSERVMTTTTVKGGCNQMHQSHNTLHNKRSKYFVPTVHAEPFQIHFSLYNLN